jgi:hypothetical protein
MEVIKIKFLLWPFYDTFTGKNIREKRQYRREGTEIIGKNTSPAPQENPEGSWELVRIVDRATVGGGELIASCRFFPAGAGPGTRQFPPAE